MTIPIDETLLRAETLFHKFKRRIEILDRKGLSLSNQQKNLYEGLRKRKGKETAESNDNNNHDIDDNSNSINDSNNNDNNNNSNISSTVNINNKKVHDLLRELLTKELTKHE
jgi:hypothetical protein